MPDTNDDTGSAKAIPPLPESRFVAIQGSDCMMTPRDSSSDTCPLCGLSKTIVSAAPHPQLINGKYTILGVIGHGGFGVVYKVKNLGLNRIEALKVVLRHRFASEEVEARFRNEVIAGARLQHPGIIRIYDTGMSDEGPFFTMEYEEKGTLKDIIDLQFPKAPTPQTVSTAYLPSEALPAPPESPHSAFVPVHSKRSGGPEGVHASDPNLPVIRPSSPSQPTSTKPSWGDVADRIALIAEAVEYMHGENVCHRDLKPTNILIGDGGRPKLTDFGLAALVAGRADDNSAGTPNYMPPEQAAEWLDSLHRPSPVMVAEEPAPRRDFFRRGDIYSLGAIFYEMLTGRPPIPSHAFPEETLKAVRTGNIVPPRQTNPAVPAKLEAICLKCLHHDPSQRYASAAEMARELREAVHPRSWTLFILGSVILLLCLVLVWAFVRPRIDRHFRVNELLALATNKESEARDLETELVARDLVKEGDNRQIDKERKELLLDACNARYRVIQDFGSRDPDHHLLYARITIDLGMVEERLRNDSEALRRYEDARAILDSRILSRSEGAMKLLAEVHHLEATILRDAKKDFEGAKKHYKDSRLLYEELRVAHPTDRKIRRNLARSHGYLGDIEVEEGKMPEAWSSYEKARKLRAELADEPDPEPEDLYMATRHSGNRGYYLEWEGKFDDAIKAYEDKRDQLTKCPRPIPRDFQSDQPSVFVQIAELQLSTPEDHAPSKILEGLTRAEKDLDVEPGLRPRFLLALGRCNSLMDKRSEASKNLSEAIRRYLRLVYDSKAQPEDYYYLSQAHAVMADVSDDPGQVEYHRAAALIRLREAAGHRFHHWQLVKRDPVYKAVRERKEFEDALETMKSRRR